MAAHHTYRILIVDDSANIHEDFNKILSTPKESAFEQLDSELFGEQSEVPSTASNSFALSSAYQGEEGVTLLEKAMSEKAPYAVAFVDMRMPPGADGLETIVKLWAIDPFLQIVICSAYSDYSWSEINRRLGVNDRLVILRKPFEPVEVQQLAQCLAEKWDLQRRVQLQLEQLETQVAERTKELHKSQALARLILENANDLITVCDARGHPIYRNSAHQRVLGYDAEEMSVDSAFPHVHAEDAALIADGMEQAMTAAHRQLRTVRMRHRDGSVMFFEILIDAVYDDDGACSCLINSARNITEREQKEIQTRLHQKLESIGLLAAGVAHEINTPTQFISDNLRFLLQAFAQFERVHESFASVVNAASQPESLSAVVAAFRAIETECEVDYLRKEVPQTLNQSLEGLERVAKIVRSLKEFSYPSSPQRALIDLNHALENAAMVCRHEWKYVATLDLKLDPTLPQVPCVADEMNQVFLNLIINASHAIAASKSKSTTPSGVIGLRTRADDSHAIVEISDTGIGIPSEIRERVFEPFFTTKPMGQGTGQGLALARSVIVNKHQGKIDFVSNPGEGTTFILHLPLKVIASDQPREEEPSALVPALDEADQQVDK